MGGWAEKIKRTDAGRSDVEITKKVIEGFDSSEAPDLPDLPKMEEK